MKRLVFLGCVPFLILLSFLTTSSRPYSKEEIHQYSKNLFEFGAVEFVSSNRYVPSEFQKLFDDVQMGKELNRVLSCEYRKTFQMVLFKNQSRFSMLDHDIHLAENYGLELLNNCSEFGILDRHDLHDLSAAQNFDDILKTIETIKSKDIGFFASTIAINNINKDLQDLMVHWAPAIHSIGLQFNSTNETTDDPLRIFYQQFSNSMKDAQFSNINSPEYWRAVEKGINAYTSLVLSVQKTLNEITTPLQRRLAGRWLDLQTIADPNVRKSPKLRAMLNPSN